MTNMPIYGCVGCSGPKGRLSCPEHGFYEVVERDAEIARLQTEAEVTTREAITVRTRLYEAVAEVERLTRENAALGQGRTGWPEVIALRDQLKRAEVPARVAEAYGDGMSTLFEAIHTLCDLDGEHHPDTCQGFDARPHEIAHVVKCFYDAEIARLRTELDKQQACYTPVEAELMGLRAEVERLTREAKEDDKMYQDTFKEQEEMFNDFRKALGLPDLVPGSDNEIPGYPHILEAIHALQGHLDKVEAVVRVAEAMLKDWRRGISPSPSLYQLADSVAAFRGRA